MVCCWPSSVRSDRTVTAPSATSLLPMMTANSAPLRSAHLHLRLHAAVLVGPVSGKACGAQLGGQLQRFEAASGVDHEDVEVHRLSCEHAFVVAGDQRSVEAQGEADAVGGRATQRLDQAVVAAAAAQCVLRRVERAALILEGRVPVVVEPAHQLGVDRERDAERGEPGLHRGEVGGGAVAVELGEARCAGDQRSILRPLRVEHSQRVLLHRRPALVAERRRGWPPSGPATRRRSAPGPPARRAS